jgi:hypothetical protein
MINRNFLIFLAALAVGLILFILGLSVWISLA